MLNLPHPTPMANFSLPPFTTKIKTMQLSPLKKMHSIGVNNDWTVKLETNGTDVIYKIDSGVQVNVMPEPIYKTPKQKSELKPTKVKLTAYNESQIPAIGQCEGKINYRDKNVNLIFIVSSRKSAPILEPDSCVKLKLIQRMMNIMQDDSQTFLPNLMTVLEILAPCQKPTIYQ